MSVYISINEEDPSEVASNSGWSQFIEWAQSLDDADEILQLAEHGVSENLDDLADELKLAVEESKPIDDVLPIVEMILELIEDEDPDSVAVVNSGITS